MVRLINVKLTLTGGGGPVNVLKGVDLEIAKGESVSVVGPSGSGKTTMLMVISGLERPTSGSVMAAGEELTRMDEDQLARFRRKHIGIVFQSFHLVPTMTALENAALPLEFAGIPDSMDRAAESLKAVGLSGRERHYPSQLSGGEQQRAAVARAFAPSPSILLADEPTGNLDGKTGGLIIDLLFSLRERSGATMILITHDQSLASRCSRRIGMLDGRLTDNPFQDA